jgi:hypothetical protein
MYLQGMCVNNAKTYILDSIVLVALSTMGLFDFFVDCITASGSRDWDFCLRNNMFYSTEIGVELKGRSRFKLKHHNSQ